MAKNDPYEPQLTALKRGPHRRAVSAADRAAFIIEQLQGWNSAALGDWEDAVAVAARRKGVHARNPTVLLARVLWGLDSKRAAEIGRIAEKFRTRDRAQLAKDILNYGGIKQVSKLGYTPPRRPRIRRS